MLAVRPRRFHASFVLFVLLWAWAAAAGAQQVVVEVDSPLLESPRGNARVIAQLRKGATAELLSRQGAWINVRTAQGTGWVNSFNVRDASAPAAGTSAASRQRGSTTATIGIRGLEAEDLKSASFNQQQINLLERYAVSKAEAERAARATGLEAVRVEYLNP